MQGEYRADITRDTFDRRHHFARVVMQQGRVFLDADWNEQTSILLHYLRALAADVIGPHGGSGDGFLVDKNDANNAPLDKGLAVQPGRYYVDGMLCENDGWTTAGDDPARPLIDATGQPVAGAATFIAYLRVWERHVTSLHVPNIREVALGGADTASRTQVIWQVRALIPAAGDPVNTKANAEATFRKGLPAPSTVRLRARVDPGEPSTTPCNLDPESRFRGAENQLYRIEIHRSGGPLPAGGNAAVAATFTWSRDNSSIDLPVRSISQGKVRLASLGRDERRTANENDWVEIVDDTMIGRPGVLWQIATVQREDMMLTLKPQNGIPFPEYLPQDPKRPLLRRWDHAGDPSSLSQGAIPVTEAAANDDAAWITLEDGVQVSFADGAGHTYRAGDYWLVPARTAIGKLLWPPYAGDAGGDKYPAVPPHGIEERYAPLAVVTVDGTGKVTNLLDLRHTIAPIAT
jgi:hypothetical protein